MSAPVDSSAVVVPTQAGAPQPAQAAAVTKMNGGGLLLSPLPLGGGKRRKTKRLSKKVLRMFKKGSRSKLMKLMKGGQEATGVVTGSQVQSEGAASGGRRKRTKRHSRRHAMLY